MTRKMHLIYEDLSLNQIASSPVSGAIQMASDERYTIEGRGAESIVQVFRRLAQRGVEIRLLHAGTPSSAALKELRRELPTNMVIRRCPRLHAKAVVIDARWMYLGSANLTGAGLGAKGDGRRNFEMGVVTESTGMIENVLQQFNQLWEGECCRNCGRREICPVPLEEPDL